MKSEHRHELKTNELERIASEWGHTAERYFHENLTLLVVAAVAIAAIAGGVVYWRSASGVAGQQGWREFASAAKTEDYGNVADKYAGTPAGAWARLMEAEMELSSGIRASFTDRAAGRSDLKKAQENFEKLVANKATPSDAMERALFGLALAKEALPDKSTSPSKVNDAAIDTYQQLVTQFPISPFKDYAEARIAALKTGTAQDFYAWFEQQNPKPADREMPKDLIPPLPDDTKTAPGTPAEKPTASSSTKQSPAKSEPKAADKKSAPLKTESKSPASSTKSPASDEGPAMPVPSKPTAK
jgi:hypothetical protein